MAINKRPLLKQKSIENLEQDLAERQKIVTIGSGFTLAANFSVNKVLEAQISSNQTLTITGLAVGETGIIFVSNTHATTGASVALPDVLTETTSAFVPALNTVEITVTRLTSTYRIKWEGALS